MVEFAIIVPVVLLILFGILQFGIVFNDYIQVTNAAREGARVGAVSRTSADPAGAAVTAARNSVSSLDTSQMSVVASDPTLDAQGHWAQGSDVTVTVTYPWSVHILGLVDFSGTLSARTIARVE